MRITVHGKELSESLCIALEAVKIFKEDDNLSCMVTTCNARDDVISLLNAYGFVVKSSYQQGIGWKVVTTGVNNASN